MDLTKVIAGNILRLLEEHNLTQAELSSYLDISRQTLANYLKGSSTIDSVRLVKTADFFGVPVNTLLTSATSQRTPMLLRATKKAHDPLESIETMVFEYIERYEQLCAKVGRDSLFIPEQHNLFIEHNGSKVSINHNLPKHSPTKFKIDDQLKNTIFSIADAQRKMLGLNDSGAIELIAALTQRGINVIFRNFESVDIFGLSIFDNSRGCYIFVNSHPDITIERQLFTVAHEFAHLILHQPLFSRDSHMPLSPQYTELLDKMADMFAGRLLCPPDIIFPYARHYSAPDSTLKSVFLITIQLKKKLHVSLQSLLMALQNYGMLSKAVVSEYFRWANSTGAIKEEPLSIKDNKPLFDIFLKAKDESIIELLRREYLAEGLCADDVAFFIGCDIEKAQSILNMFKHEARNFGEFI